MNKTIWDQLHRYVLPGIAAVLALLLILSYLFPNKVLDTYEMNLSGEGGEDMIMLPAGSVITYSMNTGKRPMRGIQPGIGASGGLFGDGWLRYCVYRQGEEEPVSDNVYDLSNLNAALAGAQGNPAGTSAIEPQYIYLPFDHYEACKGEIRIDFTFVGSDAQGAGEGNAAPSLASNGIRKEGTVTLVDGKELEGGLTGYTVYTHNTYPLVYDLRILVFMFLAAAAASPFYMHWKKDSLQMRRPKRLADYKAWVKYCGLLAAGLILAVLAEFLFFHAFRQKPAGGLAAAAEQGAVGEVASLSENPAATIEYQVQKGRRRLTPKEENSILIERENARLLAEFNGTEYVEPKDDSLVETEDGLYRKVKRNVFAVSLKEPAYIRRLSIECPALAEGTEVLITEAQEGGVVTLADAYMDERIHGGSYLIDKTLQDFQVTLSNAEEIGADEVRLLIDNTVPWNSFRILFFFAAFFLAGFFVLNRSWFGQYPERVFVLAALLIGSVFIYLTGTNQTGYDEHIHFASAYNRSFLTRVETTESVMQAEAGTFPSFANAAERKLVEQYAQENHDYGWANITWQGWFPSYDTRSYLPLSFGLWIGRIFSLPYVWCIMLARLMGLLAYTALGYASVRASLQGKVAVAALALLPNHLFAASVFTYDGIVNGFLMLAVVLSVNQLLAKKQRLTWLHALLILGAFVAGSTAKAIYILMALLLVFFPRDKFGSRLRELLFKVSAAAVCALLLYTIFFPPVSASSNYELIGNLAYAGDKRTQGTSVLGQISYILENPFSYARLLLSSMAGDLFAYLAGRKQFLNYGYLGGLSVFWTWLGALTLGFAALSAPAGEKRRSLSFGQRTLFGVMIFCVSAVVWTSMYISFTTVGGSAIEGVQGRYFLPLFLPLLFCLMNGKHKVKLGRESYAKIVLGVFVVMNLYAVGMLALKACM